MGGIPKKKVGSGREARQKRTLRSASHAGKTGAPRKQIENHLKMEVRRPAAVFLCRADTGELLPACDVLANLEAVKHFFGKMPVEREEFVATVGFMPSGDHWAVVQRSGIIRHDVDHTIQRRADRSSWLDKKVHAKVYRAPFVSRIAARAE